MIWSGNIETGITKIEDTGGFEKYSKATWEEIDYKETPDLILVKAKLKMRSTAEGGRQTGFTSGLRPNHVFEYENKRIKGTWIGDIQFEGQELIMPGEERIVTVRFLFHTPIEQYLTIGRKWWLHEGARCTGEVEIIEIKLPTTKSKLY
ncbi:hypothetical protein [Flavivirga eckloniae]|uniref:hypothetical protein n=1 Tax=Flavivirga eckloniae TaxID=1803846 RepID=UPI0013152386|nr:hypothetical protein [Flavivirga eckloniae]